MSIRCKLGFHDYQWRVYMWKENRPQVSKKICTRCDEEKEGETYPPSYQGADMEDG